ncbi:AAA family ATPase [Deinococcus sp. SM5_A1]|uniref:AAA family ATPase n=1 Tax=Deinococcus sp. SM5_A1 TaxID=3379094 RepID=UPI00385E4A7D
MLGAETTGKSTLALVESFGTTSAHEYGRDVYEREDGKLTPEHFLEIALGHHALEDGAAHILSLHRHVFCDTHTATTLMWYYRLIRIPFVSCRNRGSSDPSTPRPAPVFLLLALLGFSGVSNTFQSESV